MHDDRAAVKDSPDLLVPELGVEVRHETPCVVVQGITPGLGPGFDRFHIERSR